MTALWQKLRRSRGLPTINQKHRICHECGARFQSGVIVLERGHSIAALCQKCAHLHDKGSWGKSDA